MIPTDTASSAGPDSRFDGSTWFYVAYGLTIQSPIPLPELLPSSLTVADVVLRREPIPLRPDRKGHPLGTYLVKDGVIRLVWDDVGAFVLRDGREILMDPLPGIEDARLRVYLLGPVLGNLLVQRGMLVLHGSSVAVEQHAIAFLGTVGRGKSTLAAALHARGHTLLADDIVPVDVDGGGPAVVPSFPQLKLWPESLLTLGDDADAMPRIHSTVEKRDKHVCVRFARSPLPLERIYLLTDGDRISIQAVGSAQAVIELVRQSWSTKVMEKAGLAPAHLRRCATVVDSVSVRRLARPRALSHLPDLARAVEDDLLRGAG